MKVFRVEDQDQPHHFEGTQSAAHKWVKDNIDKSRWGEVIITICEVQTDKEGVVAMLNGAPIVTSEGDKFGLTKRGGLEPIKD